MHTDPRNIEKVRQWSSPSSVKEIRQFLGLAGYYRKFVRHSGVTSRCLTELLKKGVPFVWTADHEQACESLKTALTTAPVRAGPAQPCQAVRGGDGRI